MFTITSLITVASILAIFFVPALVWATVIAGLYQLISAKNKNGRP